MGEPHQKRLKPVPQVQPPSCSLLHHSLTPARAVTGGRINVPIGSPSNCQSSARPCLQSSEPEQAHADGEHGEVVDAALFVAGGDTPELLEPVDQPLDAVAFSVGLAVERRVARLVALGRDHRPNAAAPDPPSGGGAAVALVAGHPAGPQAGSAAALAPDRAL